MSEHFLIVGGSDAGISAALRVRELRPDMTATLVVADAYPNFSICGLPFFLSGEVTHWRNLDHRTRADIEAEGIHLLLDHRAEAVDPEKRTATVVGSDGERRELAWDQLLIGTGAVSARPKIDGLDRDGVFFLRWMDDSFAVKRFLEERKPESAVIVGAGYIGMEMADALTFRGIQTTVVEYGPRVLPTLDPELSAIIRKTLENHGVRVAAGMAVERIEESNGHLVVHGSKGFSARGQLVLVATGGRPETALAVSAGAKLGAGGAIRVNRRMEIGVPGIYAAGDCVETWHRLLRKPAYLPLGTTAHKQGRVAGENAAGGTAEFAGSLGTQSVKIFDKVAARTGLRDDEARAEGFDPLSADLESWDHKVYFPGAKSMVLRVTGDRNGGKLLGAQIVGAYGTEVSKRIDIFAAALHHGMTVAELSHLDLSYTPPLSSPWDPVQMAAQAWEKARREGEKT
jgi:NADPH-dependent 2,4-dienoyl-CoA reductase/sulfur reductase-like enzyme